MITQTDFDEILSALAQPTLEEREADITPQALRTKASNMVSRGYDFSAESLEALRLYMAGYSLFIHGPVGTGKTMFFRTLRNHRGKPIYVFPVHAIFGKNESEIAVMMDGLADTEIAIDDLGSEPMYNNYGVKFDILTYIISRRLESSCRTHITTNLSKADIAKRYGARIIDRFAEMCRAVEFKGKSRRRPKPNQEVVKAIAAYANASASTPSTSSTNP